MAEAAAAFQAVAVGEVGRLDEVEEAAASLPLRQRDCSAALVPRAQIDHRQRMDRWLPTRMVRGLWAAPLALLDTPGGHR